MHFLLNTADGRPIYIQIMDEVRRAVVLGTLRAEDPLPSVRQLSADLRLNPNTVAQAYRELERQGVVYVRRGQGTFVAPRDTPDAERWELVRGVVERALVDAHRNGVSSGELIEALRVRSEAGEPESS